MIINAQQRALLIIEHDAHVLVDLAKRAHDLDSPSCIASTRRSHAVPANIIKGMTTAETMSRVCDGFIPMAVLCRGRRTISGIFARHAIIISFLATTPAREHDVLRASSQHSPSSVRRIQRHRSTARFSVLLRSPCYVRGRRGFALVAAASKSTTEKYNLAKRLSEYYNAEVLHIATMIKASYRRAFSGTSTVQAEALPPDVLAAIVRDAIRERVDREAYNEVLGAEERVKRELDKELVPLLRYFPDRRRKLNVIRLDAAAARPDRLTQGHEPFKTPGVPDPAGNSTGWPCGVERYACVQAALRLSRSDALSICFAVTRRSNAASQWW